MRAPDLIRRKRDGERLAAADIRAFIQGYADGVIPDYQMAAMAMAIFFRGLDEEELVVWTDAMMRSGDLLDFPDAPGPLVDKHSTGGVGDKTSFVLAPIAAAAGLAVPMISGRGLGHTGGTLDKLESIPGLKVALPTEQLREIVNTHGLVIAGQTERLVPADRRLYALRDVTATVRCLPLIASSIMSKKLAEGLEGLVLDIKVGSGAFLRDVEEARTLARSMIALGAGMGVQTRALLTDMDQPLGRAVGNALEIEEALATLSGGGPDDLRALSLELAAEMLLLGGRAADLDAARALAAHTLDSGAALERLREVIRAQGGDPDAPLPRAEATTTLPAWADGYLTRVQCSAIGYAAARLGAGRTRADEPVDHAVGVVLHKKTGDPVRGGEPLLTLHHRAGALPHEVRGLVLGALTIAADPPPPRPLVLERIAAP